MIYRFLFASRSGQRSPLPTGICIEKRLQLSRSCDCLKRVWVSSYIPAFFQPWLSSLNGPRCVSISLLECRQKRLWFLHWEHVAFLVHVSSRDARICTAKPHGTVQQCLCGVDPMAAFRFLQPLRQSDDDFRMRKTSPFSNIFFFLALLVNMFWSGKLG